MLIGFEPAGSHLQQSIPALIGGPWPQPCTGKLGTGWLVRMWLEFRGVGFSCHHGLCGRDHL